ncbi:DNAJ heat shock N-terminal domain-containing protein [Artemisia annua]|uniref:DNAJ heat shock N-terminal domain-containing protein n=1 Tax=Artemisia annua TaxID=35608 RepID=A0A2U1M0Q5_ARTAN|nr:DNAJ heat shock N-terminal domain-containing protein [Artemisia annua]
MDPNTIEEALRAKENAEKLFIMKDFTGAKQFAIRAQMLCPQLDGIAQMAATFEIFASIGTNSNHEVDLYSVFGLDPSADKSVIKKRYKKMAVLLHPDKNKTIGADEAFRLVSEAWAILSDNAKRNSYDAKRNRHATGGMGSDSSPRLDTFWTVCTTCRVQYEYLRKYVNKRLSCKNCRGVFVAIETGAAPVTYAPWSYTSENGYANQSYNTGNYPPTTSVCFTSNGGSTVTHATQGYDYAGTVAFQWNTHPGSSTVDPNSLQSKSVNSRRAKANGRQQARAPGERPRMGRPPKKRKIENGETGLRNEQDSVLNNVNGNVGNHVFARQYSIPPAFDARKLLIDKARSVIRGKLKEMKSAPALKTEKIEKPLKKSGSMAITVPDPDFHDFDTDRSEEVFKPKQIWAIYDEEDGMPRLYCLVREVLSVKPFQLHINYLNSKPDTEFGFNKSCGSFKVAHANFVDQVNIFSHLLGRENVGKGGCVNIYPKRGDIWAVYKNWSKKPSKKVRHQFEMVEILDDYSEKLGVSVTPLVKLEGYKTVYQRNPNKNAVRLIPRKEMVRFSHQVPSCLLKGQGLNLPDGCWDLDPAATPEQLLQADTDADEEEKKVGVTGVEGRLNHLL